MKDLLVWLVMVVAVVAPASIVVVQRRFTIKRIVVGESSVAVTAVSIAIAVVVATVVAMQIATEPVAIVETAIASERAIATMESSGAALEVVVWSGGTVGRSEIPKAIIEARLIAEAALVAVAPAAIVMISTEAAVVAKVAEVVLAALRLLSIGESVATTETSKVRVQSIALEATQAKVGVGIVIFGG